MIKKRKRKGRNKGNGQRNESERMREMFFIYESNLKKKGNDKRKVITKKRRETRMEIEVESSG